MKVLYTTPVLEHPPASGPQLRVENSIKALSQVSELYILSQVEKSRIGGESAEDFYKQLCSGFAYSLKVKLGKVAKGNGVVSRIAGRVFNRLEDFLYVLEAHCVLYYAKKYKVDVVWFGYGNISNQIMRRVRKYQPSLKLICDTDSVWSRFVLREIPFEQDLTRRMELVRSGLLKQAEEMEWVEFCDVTTAVSLVDAEYYKGITYFPDRVKIFSNVIDLESYVGVVPPPSDFRSPSIYLAGSFGRNSPMDKAARWMINDVFPILLERYTDLYFYIVGSESKETLSDVKHDRIIIAGKLPSVLPYLCNASVALVPLMFESGTRFKIMEAAACGVPIVSTTLGAEGIPVIHNEHILIADTGSEFVHSIGMLLDDPSLGRALAKNCKDCIQELNSIQTLKREAEQILDFLTNDKNL